MSAGALLQKRRAFISSQESGRDFLLQLLPLLEALRRDQELRAQLDALAREAAAHRAAITHYDIEAVPRLIALGNDIRTMFPSPDPATHSDEPVRPWYWASFDRDARGSLELKEFALPDDQTDPTVASELLPFLRGKLQNLVNEAERTGDDAPIERSSPLWDRYNAEQTLHEYAVRDFHVREASHAGWSLSRIEYVAGLLNRRPTPEQLRASSGLDLTPWEPVARAVTFAVFGTKPSQLGRLDVEAESIELVAALRKDVSRLCEELDLRLSTTIHEEQQASAQPGALQAGAPAAHSSAGDDAGSLFEDATWESMRRLLPVDALLMTAVKVELRAVRSRLLPPPGFTRVLRLPWEESTYYIGRIGSYTCAVVMSDAGSGGRMGAALTLIDAIARLSPSFALAVGMAFGKDADSQNLGDVLVSTFVIPYESERVQPSGDVPRAPHPEAGMVLLNRLRTLDSEDAVPFKVHFGPLLSGEKLVDDAAFKGTLFTKHPSAIGGEMEAAGIYAAAARRRLEWAVIKAICDWGDGTKNKDHQERAAQNSSEVMTALLSRAGLERSVFSPSIVATRVEISRTNETATREQLTTTRTDRTPSAGNEREDKGSNTDQVSKVAGDAYQRLTQRVFEVLLAQQSVSSVRVEHDVTLRGLATEHQIDVYWEFETGGITYRTVVECRDGDDPVDENALFALQGVLRDLPGQPRGVVVARSGFQEGAERFAKAHGIVLYELRAPKDEDWKGFITSINIKGQLLVPKLHGIDFKADDDWLTREMKRCGIPSMEAIPPVQGVLGELTIEREDGSPLTTVGDVVEAHLCPRGVGPPEWREHLFAEAAYIPTGLSSLPRVRLRGLRASVELVVGFTQDIQVRLERLVGLILKEGTEGTFKMLDAEGRPLEAGQPRPARIVEDDDEDT